MKIILDTNVYLSAFAFDGSVETLVKQIIINGYSIFFSPATKLELEQKFSDKYLTKILNKSKRKITNKQRDEFIKGLEQIVTIANPSIKINICRDPDDNKLLELAKTVEADFLITGDTDLLILKEFEGTKILKPSQFLDIVL